MLIKFIKFQLNLKVDDTISRQFKKKQIPKNKVILKLKT